jgi:hypothetical protein
MALTKPSTRDPAHFAEVRELCVLSHTDPGSPEPLEWSVLVALGCSWCNALILISQTLWVFSGPSYGYHPAASCARQPPSRNNWLRDHHHIHGLWVTMVLLHTWGKQVDWKGTSLCSSAICNSGGCHQHWGPLLCSTRSQLLPYVPQLPQGRGLGFWDIARQLLRTLLCTWV